MINLKMFYLLFLLPVTVFADIPSLENAKEQSQRYIEFRNKRWPNYNQDKDFMSFLSKQYSPLTKTLLNNDVQAFMKIWSKLDDRLRRFYVTDYDFTSGKTPLHAAAGALPKARNGAKDSSAIVLALCKYVDENNIKDYQGDSPLTTSLGVEQGNFHISKALIEDCSADIGIQNNAGLSSLMLTALHGNADFFNYLIDAGADDWALDLKGKGVFYYYNLGRIRNMFIEEEAKGILNWLNLNGHDFYKEAISKCFGFSAKGVVRTDEIRFYPFSETKDNMTKSFDFLIPKRKFDIAREKLEEELIKECEMTGYKLCTPLRLPEFYKDKEYVANEKTSLAGEEGYIYYGYRTFIAGVIGSATSNPKDCTVK